VIERAQLLDLRETLTPADHQTHRRYLFDLPARCRSVEVRVHYGPKFASQPDSAALAREALGRQTAALSTRVGARLAAQWAAEMLRGRVDSRPIPNLVTISVDDAAGSYRGAAHRQAEDQRLFIGVEHASPGLISGPLPAGQWALTLSAHTLISPQVEVSIQIGAEIASSRP
jgi:hypothetical protein